MNENIKKYIPEGYMTGLARNHPLGGRNPNKHHLYEGVYGKYCNGPMCKKGFTEPNGWSIWRNFALDINDICKITDQSIRFLTRKFIENLRIENTMSVDFQHNFEEITSGDYLFNKKDIMISASKQINRVKLISFVKNLFINKRKQLTIAIYSNKHKDAKNNSKKLRLFSSRCLSCANRK